MSESVPTIHVLNGKLVNEGVINEGHLVLEEGRIASISSNIPSSPADQIIDANGAWVIPGLIDDQVHFRQPGFPKKGTIRTESMAAAAGGITSYMEMPNTYPPTLDQSALDQKLAIAAKDSYANYAFYMGASNDNLEAIKRVKVRSTAGVKIFMGSSTGNMKVSETEILEKIFEHAPTIVATHCEDDDMIAVNLEKYKAIWGDDIPARYHPEIRSREACLASSKVAVELAKRHGAQLNILHITTEDEVSLFEAADLATKSITSEACVHHMFFSEERYEQLQHRLKCNPAVKKESDRKAIIQGILDDRIDIIATDHAPHELEYKGHPYTRAPAGLPLAQHSLKILLELVHHGELPLETVIRKACHNVADRYQVKDRGYLREGYFADIVVCRPLEDARPSKGERLYSQCGWSPLEDDSFHSVIEQTIVSGNLVYDGANILGNPSGEALEFDR